MTTLLRTPQFTVEVAGPADGAELCALFRDVHVEGDLALNQERDPDFFALQRCHDGPALTLVARDPEGRACALASAVARDAWLDGRRIRSAYLCDLRVRPGFRGGALLLRHYGALLEHLQRELSVAVCTTVVFDANEAARRALMGPAAARRGQPAYRPMTPFEMVSVQFVLPHRGPRRPVRPARGEDLPALEAFLDRRGRGRLLGEPFDDGLLRRRLATWPGFCLDDVLLLEEGGRIRGCLAPWDNAAAKRTRVLGYAGGMARLKTALDLGAAVLRFPRLPDAGQCFRFAWATHLEVEDDDPDVLQDLLRAAMARLRPRRLHFLACFLPVGSPLAPAFRPFVTQRTAMTLYAVHPPGSPLAARDFRTLRPGFEMALS